MSHYYVIEMEYRKPEPHHKLCMQDGLVTLQQRRQNCFLVRYGREIHADLTYSEACYRLGQALMHQLACDDKLDNAAAA